ncbi:unnamed protein product [Nezara viridula]|uniref:RNA helicase n=1 Tax=Nezara viridula TaxID=85310 RepID=A0A9P0E455_NEZVI|nr:unnamed protein product [Nezara viridula]
MNEEYSSEISNHSLQDGFIEVLNVIDPFTYSVRCQDCLSSEEINVELKRIIPECVSLKSDNVDKINSLVIVEESDGKYYRGYLKYKEEKNIFYVNRIDIGDDISIQSCNVYYLNESLFKLEAQRHTIKLYGIIPSPEVTSNQLNDCYVILADLIRNTTNATLNECYLIDKFYYGSIEVVTYYNNKFCNIFLKDILLEKRVAHLSNNFEHDISAKNGQQESIPEHSLIKKVAVGLRNIEITPQHSLYLNALTSGLLINPESFTDCLLKTETPKSKRPAVAVENKLDKRREGYEMADLQQFPGIGHGRASSSFPNKSGQSGGRGKIKSLLQNFNDNKTIQDSQFQSQDVISKSDFPDCGFFERPESSSVKVNYVESKNDSKLNTSLMLNQFDKDSAENVIYSANEINKNTMSEELCFQLLKGKNKKLNSDPRNKKSKYFSQSHKSKAHNYHHDATFSFPTKENYNENSFNQNQNEQIPVNSFSLGSRTFSSVNKTSPLKQEPDQVEHENSPFKSLTHDDMTKVDTKRKVNTNSDIRENYEFQKDSSFSENNSSIVSSPSATPLLLSTPSTPAALASTPASEEKSIKNDGHIKSMGRGFLFNKFTESQRSNYDSVSVNKYESLQKSKDYNDLPSCSKFESLKKSNDVLCDSSRERKSESPEKSIGYNNLPRENNSEVLQKSKDEQDIINDSQDTSDHEDRYFDIEEPTYLNCTKEFTPLDNKIETSQNVVKSDDEHYEKLLNLAPDSEHEPLDDKSLVNSSAQAKLEGDLEQQILRDYSVGQIPERMKMSCGLIHGNVNANPVSKLSDLKLEQHVFSNLNAKNMRELSRSQMFAVPVLLQRRNLVLIGPPNSGKTLAYVMSFLSLLHDNEYYSSLKPGNGPRCIFVSSCAQNVNYISQFCSAICGAKLTIITTHGGGLELERKEDLTNGCEILVTTPRCLLRLLKHTSVTNLFRVCHIVFDDIDSLLSTFCTEVKEIMGNLNKMLQIRKRYSGIGIQVVLVGEKWTPLLEEITFKGLDSPVLCITAHLEAALYARIKPKTYILSPDNKVKKLKELLDCTSKIIRTVIVCRSADEVKSLRPLLELTMSDVLVAHEEMGLNQLIEVGDLWIRCTSPPILLCSDLVLAELAVTNAQWLIHYSMPDNKSSFSERFSTIKEHLYDRIKYPKTAPPECQVHILVDDTNELQFPELITFLKRLNTSIPDVILEAVKKISVLKEEKKIGVPFCENLLMLGKCWRNDKCKRQHIFIKSRDTPDNLPVNGNMKVKLLYAHNPSHYSVRILAIKNSDNDEWTEFPSYYAIIALKMSNYFSFRENRFAHGRVKIGDLVAIEVEPDLMFKRAKVIDIITRDDKYNPVEVLIHFIDEGSVDKMTVSELLHLPSELQIYSQEAYDLYLLGLQPVDYDKSWSYASTLKIQKSISNLNFQEGDNKFFTANVALVTGKNLLATSFLCYEWLDLNKCHVVLFSPKKFILETGLAEPNVTHYSTLMNLALDAGLISHIPKEFKKSDIDEDVEKIQWAHLDKDNTNIVHVISSDSPSLFFLKLFKFSDRLEELEKELTAILDLKVTSFETLEYDMICAAKNPNDNRWNRGMVNNVTADEVEIFFVDYGDILVVPWSSVSRLPKGFISRLPFQAIECSLVGISPLDADWLPQAIEAFDSMCSNDEHKLLRMFAKVCDATSASFTTGRHFKVILAPSMDEKDAYINKQMVYRGFANWDVQTKHYLTENIVWSEDAVEEEVWDDDNDQESDKEDKEDENVDSNNTLPQTNETKAVATTTGGDSVDILSILTNGDFDLGNTDFLLALLPPELQKSLKDRNVDKALEHLKQLREESRKEKVLKSIAYKPVEDLEETGDIVEGPLLESCGLFHPEVFWSQQDCYIRIKINLAEISKFQLDYSDQILIFRALANEKYYWFEIILFGLINKESVTYASRGLYFEIKMEKFIKGEFWPRLVYDDFKFPWIKLDPDYIEQDDLSLIESMFKKGSKFRGPGAIEFNSDYDLISSGVPEPDSDLESVSSRSDIGEFTDLVHDSLDPDSD